MEGGAGVDVEGVVGFLFEDGIDGGGEAGEGQAEELAGCVLGDHGRDELGQGGGLEGGVGVAEESGVGGVVRGGAEGGVEEAAEEVLVEGAVGRGVRLGGGEEL